MFQCNAAAEENSYVSAAEVLELFEREIVSFRSSSVSYANSSVVGNNLILRKRKKRQ